MNSQVVLTVEARMDGETPKMVAQSLRPVEDVVANAGAGLRIVVDNPEPLDIIKSTLADGGQGNGYVYVTLSLADRQRRVELTLPNRYKVSPLLKDTLDIVPGILDVQEI